ncbi:MAG: GNAT family N-acetyltransferase [Bdellovibrionota bacterium]|nr:GNAT family N-acetyltransferase [Bdellovibrionota bacterium]
MDRNQRSLFTHRKISEEDLEMILEWRNSEAVRVYMFESDVIPMENHRKWFQKLGEDRKCWLLFYKNEPAGVFYKYLRDKEKDIWIWGCYLGDPGIVKHLGTCMGLIAQECFFEEEKVKTVIGEMVASNDRSRKFNLNLGFRIEHDLTITTSKGEEIPAVYLELHQDEWLKKKPELFEKYFA